MKVKTPDKSFMKNYMKVKSTYMKTFMKGQ